MAQKCVHQGCGKQYTDPDEVCKYHPGPPVFHEGQKGEYRRRKQAVFRPRELWLTNQAGRAASRGS